MAFTKKTLVQGRSGGASDIPQTPPRMSEALVRKFPELGEYQAEFDKFWFDVLTAISRRLEQATSATATEEGDTDLTALEAQVTAATAAAATASTKAALALGTANTTASQLDSFSAHIGQTSAHGTSGQVVGTTDEQSLEKKTIGLTDPRYGRFSTLISGLLISVTDTITVPSEFGMVLADSLRVDGELIIEGNLVVV